MKSRQEIFNIAVSGLLVQGRKSKHPTTKVFGTTKSLCMYHAPNGDRCAVGQLIPSAINTNDIEGKSVGAISYFLEPFGVPQASDDLLWSLQQVHDEQKVSDWPQKFRQVASQYSLSDIVIDEFVARDNSSLADSPSASGDPSAPAQLTRRLASVTCQL